MNEEEKEAIKVIKHSLELEKQLRNGYKWKTGFYENLSIEKLLNLVEKQQKEIENYQILKDDIEGHRIVYVDTPEFEENYISKDKIKEKIEELKNRKIGASTGIFAVQVDILEELLGETNEIYC